MAFIIHLVDTSIKKFELGGTGPSMKLASIGVGKSWNVRNELQTLLDMLEQENLRIVILEKSA